MKYIHIGGLVAMGFDPSGQYLLVVTHSGRGIFSTHSWEKINRDHELSYPENGTVKGIDPIEGLTIQVEERNEFREIIEIESPDGNFQLTGESDVITITQK